MMNLHSLKLGSNVAIKSLCALVLVALTACGGGGGTPDGVVTEDIDITRYLDTDARLRPDFTAIRTADLPASGRATFDGAIAGQLSGETLTANLQVVADYAMDELSATASGFQTGSGANLSGSLTGSDPIDRASSNTVPQFQLTIDGQLDGQASTLALDGAYVAQSGQTSVIAVAGQVEGEIAGNALENGAFAAD